jgi:Uma2 family endonuclease
VSRIAPASMMTMTLEQMLALPDDRRVDRELIRGELRERPRVIPTRHYGSVMARLGRFLGDAVDQSSETRGEIVSRAGFRLHRDPDTVVDIDMAYVSAQIAMLSPESPCFDGSPVLAVEVLLPTDLQGDLDEKVELCLETGVAIVWVIHPVFRTVTVYRPDVEPELFNVLQELSAEPHLPGFHAPVARLFPG